MSDDEAELPGGAVVAAGDEILPGYRVVGLLRRGHRLDVYDAWSVSRASRCVVKIVLPDRRHEQHVVDDLVQEGSVLSGLDHPHWVRVYEVVPERAAIVLETLGGATLAALLDDARRLRPADVVLLGAQVASALRYLHSTGWLHLDLTPSNVVVEAGRARLIDLSLVARPGPVRRGMGTLGYRAPETLASGQVSAATDVHGLGTLLHECLTGFEPGAEDAPAPRPTLRDRLRRSTTPSWLAELVDACRRSDPAARPTLDEALAALDPFARQQDPQREKPLTARSSSPHAVFLD